MSGQEGIVLDAETAAVVPDIGFVMRPYRAGFSRMNLDPGHRAKPGDLLTHLPTPTGLRPVAELVAAHDEAKAHAERMNTLAAVAQLRAMDGDREVWEDCLDAADHFDRLADLLIDARLVAAAHAQWADTERVPS